ncbi:OLC1v1011380C1 [Oldenlandia corymbosa var. corymbosa]|uniref:OLC1v1011380C1 n=1 Tax=Oldenlandia corymbosa var. corymbosa TaxID=529605 RepID=A0AAV1DWP3_OLDCO|nr:OLC1v1011380C1 [Oldenlandia corymbosa var. corymbosa]
MVQEHDDEQAPANELGKSSDFYRRIYSEIEEIGWDRLVRIEEDLKHLSFRIVDKKGRVHILEITIDSSYPECPPSVSADVPRIFNLDWSISSTLKDVLQQFQRHLEKLQDFWSALDEIDKCFSVVDPKHPSLAVSYRQIHIGNDCYLLLSLNAQDPRSLPECRFLGSDSDVSHWRKIWLQNCKRWNKEKPFSDNLASVMKIQLHEPPDASKCDQQTECGVCYAQYLPVDDELGSSSGASTDYTCENNNCSRAFHSVCLGDWLRSITTSRRSFDVMFGNCPYCSSPVAVRMNAGK